ncbi:MAG TPA: ATP-binding cassette domain-containing protein [Streptosporangiaceae bacterium]|nr:ATP-binding cassette domain-containing protein [Streptosporangiaceae bacterium]
MASPSSQATAAIAVTGLRKSYGEHTVLDGIDLTVPPGTVFALLGPNGAGKTTTVQILSTLIHADGGQAMLAGHDLNTEPARVREVIGVTGQYSAVDKLLTGRENLMLMADLYHLGRNRARARAEELLERFDLTEAAGRLVTTYSGGMQRKLDLAMTLVSEPRIIFLDEPTTGLDPRSRRTMWQMVKDLTRGGVTIFLTTQYLDEADQLADRVALLDHGVLIAEGTPEELKRMIPGGSVRLRFTEAVALSKARAVIARPAGTAGQIGTALANEEALTLEIPTDGSVPELRGILARLDDHGIDVAELTVHTPDLDDVFLTLTSR